MSHRSFCIAGLFTALGALGACAPLDDDEPTGGAATATEEVTACGSAQHATATASVAQDGNPASQAVDGNLATRWSGLGVGASLTLDLGAAKTVCNVSIAWYNGATRRNHFVLTTSSDGTHFTDAHAGDSSGTTNSAESYAITPVAARYVRLTVHGNTVNDWASVSEISVAGSAIATGFRHPGIVVTTEGLDFVKGRIDAHAEPWYSAYTHMRGSRYGSASWAPHPVPVVELGLNSVPNVGGDAETDDAIAAYTQTLIYYFTGDTSYAARAAAIFNAWSATLTGRTGANVPLRTAWSAEVFTRAAELLRYTYSGWSAADANRFGSLLTRLYLPLIRNGWWGGNNWQTSMTEAVMNIAVYTDDHTLYDHAVSMWRAGTPAYVYLSSDGPLPVRPIVGTFTDDALRANWKNPPRFVDGLTMETCRDFGHTQMGLAAIFNAAETARIQGLDLYSEQAHRLTVASEFNSTYINGAAIPSWLCGGTLVDVGMNTLTFEIAYNHYVDRVGMTLPHTLQMIARSRPTSAGLHMDWETLTHAGLGSIGLH